MNNVFVKDDLPFSRFGSCEMLRFENRIFIFWTDFRSFTAMVRMFQSA